MNNQDIVGAHLERRLWNLRFVWKYKQTLLRPNTVSFQAEKEKAIPDDLKACPRELPKPPRPGCIMEALNFAILPPIHTIYASFIKDEPLASHNMCHEEIKSDCTSSPKQTLVSCHVLFIEAFYTRQM